MTLTWKGLLVADPYLYQRHMEREEDRLAEAVNSGEMTNAEYNAEMRDLQLDLSLIHI